MERVMREQSRKIDQIGAELKHARDTMEVGQTTSAIYRDTVEANQRRLEVEGAFQRNEIYSLRLALQEMQAQVQGHDSPPVYEAPAAPVHVEPENAEAMEPEIAAPAPPEIDLFAHEDLNGFDFEMEDHLGGVQILPNMFAWANANADGFDPDGHGPPPDDDVEIVSNSESEGEPSKVEGSSGIDDVPAPSPSTLSAASQHNYDEMIEENSVDQPPPAEVANNVPMIPPGRTLMTVNQDVLQAAMARLGVNTIELGIYPYGG
jgi:hypothetical protein